MCTPSPAPEVVQPLATVPGAAMTLHAFAASVGVPYGTAPSSAGVTRACRRIASAFGSGHIVPDIASAWVAAKRGSSVSFGRRGQVVLFQSEDTGDVRVGYSSEVERRASELRKETGARVQVVLAKVGKPKDANDVLRTLGDGTDNLGAITCPWLPPTLAAMQGWKALHRPGSSEVLPLVSSAFFRAGEGIRSTGGRSAAQSGRAESLTKEKGARSEAHERLPFNRAGEGIRTLDVHLGKVALYH